MQTVVRRSTAKSGCPWMRARKSRRSNTSNSVGSSVVTVALCSLPASSASSPRTSPGPRMAKVISFPSSEEADTFTRPLTTINRCVAGSPLLMIVCLGATCLGLPRTVNVRSSRIDRSEDAARAIVRRSPGIGCHSVCRIPVGFRVSEKVSGFDSIRSGIGEPSVSQISESCSVARCGCSKGIHPLRPAVCFRPGFPGPIGNLLGNSVPDGPQNVIGKRRF